MAENLPRFRSVSGSVTDQDGRPIESATVRLHDPRTMLIRSCVTLEDGAYVFHGLSRIGGYELRCEYHGQFSDTRFLSRFDSALSARIDFTLDVQSSGAQRPFSS